jgi:hypothetical protein
MKFGIFSAGWELIASPEIMIAASGLVAMAWNSPVTVADAAAKVFPARAAG